MAVQPPPPPNRSGNAIIDSYLESLYRWAYLLWDNQTGSGAGITPISAGGTGSITEATARDALGLEIGSDVQAYSANLDEAVTFFGATDITGSEAQTLTGGTNADSLHAHAHNNTTGKQGGTTNEYYHLDSSQHTALTGGNDADALHGHDTYKTLINAIRGYLTGDRLFSGNPDLAIDTNFDVQTQNAVEVSIDGTLHDVAAATCDTGTTATFPAGTWGIFLVSSDSAGALTATWATNTSNGYANEADAIAALPALPTDEAPIGYVTVQADAANSFTAGTDALTTGTGGNPAQTTNYYNLADPMSVIGAALA